MANPENIQGHEFKPGQSGNPAGRPKGSKSLSTVLKEMLEEEITVSIDGQPAGKKPFKEVIVRRLLKAANDGDIKAIGTIFDRVDGKAPQHIEIANPDGESFNTSSTHEVIFRDFSQAPAAAGTAKARKKRKVTKPRKA